MSGTGNNKKKQRQPHEVLARLDVNVCEKEPEKDWNDLWTRILTEFTVAHRDEDEVRSTMERG
jgi:hypothetical protein